MHCFLYDKLEKGEGKFLQCPRERQLEVEWLENVNIDRTDTKQLTTVTYQTNEQEKYQECPAEHCLTIHVSVAYGGHGDDEKVNACPVRHIIWILKLKRVPWVLQLVETMSQRLSLILSSNYEMCWGSLRSKSKHVYFQGRFVLADLYSLIN